MRNTTRATARFSSASDANALPNATSPADETISVRPPPLHYVVTGLKRDGALSEHRPDSTASIQEPTRDGTQLVNIPRELARPASIRPIEVTKERFIVLGAWECVVEEVRDETFVARIVDLNNSSPDELAEFYKTDLSDEDASLLEDQAVLYWFVGYSDSKSGQRSRSSVLRVQRLPAWTEEEDRQAQAWADETGRALQWPR
jgi:hypothetical protein